LDEYYVCLNYFSRLCSREPRYCLLSGVVSGLLEIKRVLDKILVIASGSVCPEGVLSDLEGSLHSIFHDLRPLLSELKFSLNSEIDKCSYGLKEKALWLDCKLLVEDIRKCLSRIDGRLAEICKLS